MNYRPLEILLHGQSAQNNKIEYHKCNREIYTKISFCKRQQQQRFPLSFSPAYPGKNMIPSVPEQNIPPASMYMHTGNIWTFGLSLFASLHYLHYYKEIAIRTTFPYTGQLTLLSLRAPSFISPYLRVSVTDK